MGKRPGLGPHLTFALIVGNPKTGLTVATFAIALLIALVFLTAFVALRKRTAPLKEPPLHPSAYIPRN